MRKILFLGFLIVGFLGVHFISQKVHAEDVGTWTSDSDPTTQLSPGQVHDAGVAACEPNEQLFSDDPTACQNAVGTCVGHFQQCIYQTCNVVPNYYNTPYAYCTYVQIESCKATASEEFQEDVKPACAYFNPSGPSITITADSPVFTIPGAAPIPTPTPTPGPVWEPRPPINEDVPTVKPNIPTMVSNPQVAFEGSGCSLANAAMGSGLDGGMILSVMLVTGLWLRKRPSIKI